MLNLVTLVKLRQFEQRIREIADVKIFAPQEQEQKDIELPDTVDALVVGYGMDLSVYRLLLESGRTFRWIHTLSTGIEVLGMAKEHHEALLTCSRGASAIPISEWVLAVMLSQVKQLPSQWIDAPVDSDFYGRFRAESLYGKQLAILGYGGIGQAVAQRAQAFGLSIKALVRRPRPMDETGVEFVQDVHDLVEGADYIVLAAPGTEATYQIINKSVFDRMKPGAFLINVGRGTLIDQEAMKAALDNNQLSGAALDVSDPEPLPAGHWVFSHPKVKLSPHISSVDPEIWQYSFQGFLTNLRLFADNKPLENIVDLKEGY